MFLLLRVLSNRLLWVRSNQQLCQRQRMLRADVQLRRPWSIALLMRRRVCLQRMWMRATHYLCQKQRRLSSEMCAHRDNRQFVQLQPRIYTKLRRHQLHANQSLRNQQQRMPGDLHIHRTRLAIMLVLHGLGTEFRRHDMLACSKLCLNSELSANLRDGVWRRRELWLLLWVFS